MASHVVVVHPSLKRATVKVSPGTHMSDVVSEACKKLGLRNEQYELRYNKKNVDLSLTFRLSSLPSGAQLELIQSSRSPTVISVALQLPDTRLTEKFPSTASIWHVLRRFEDNASSNRSSNSSSAANITQRGIAKADAGSTGAGRLYYEIPVVNVMGRELATFEDLQKTLAQLGFSSGSALLRLSFRETGRPLEEAMQEISQYFQGTEPAASSAGPAAAETSSSAVPEPSAALHTDTMDVDTTATGTEAKGTTNTPNATESLPASIGTPEPSQAPTSTATPTPGSSSQPSRQTTVFAAPSSSTPRAASFPHNESDYTPTVDHAKLHQARLGTESRNRRLPSDAEIAAAETAREEKLASISAVRIRVRMPDQSSVESEFARSDDARALYAWVRGVLARPEEPFGLRYTGPKGAMQALAEDGKKLVGGHGFQGRVLVNCVWGDAASREARLGPSLKQEFRDRAQEIKVVPPPKEEPEDNTKPAGAAQAKSEEKKSKSSFADKEARLKKLFGLKK